MHREAAVTAMAYFYKNPLINQETKLGCNIGRIEKIYQDIGDRRQLRKLIEDCQNEKPDCLMVSSLASLGDNLEEVEGIITHLESLGVEIIAANEGYKTSDFKVVDTPTKRNKLREIWKQIEKELQRRKLILSHAIRKMETLPPPGRAPFGYIRGNKGYMIDPVNAPIIREFFRVFLLSGSLRRSVKYLEEKYQKKISPSTAKNWLKNPVYRGDLLYNKNTIVSDTHPPIITRQESAQIERLLRNNKKFAPKSVSSKHCLAGLLKCKSCQCPLRVNPVSNKTKGYSYLYLTPTNCPKNKPCKSLSYNSVLTRLIETICNLFEAIKETETERDKIEETRNIEREEIKKIKEKLEVIRRLEDEGVLEEEEAKKITYRLREKMSKMQQKINQMPPNTLGVIAKNLSNPQLWHDLSNSERRFYLREFIDTIEVNMGENHDDKLELNLVFANPQIGNSWQNKLNKQE
ncbi:MAG: recombinase family protein [Geminocystis sp.]|nr:recombinase family protein [Geminocystis sp.]HIK36509.1 recombinase family protein [Geminocystis sp. M7585_C2015_104]MCS7146746.1 recombinase family protein [Geminocystis sp.]MCX8077104.1 recombinase family protein [Geminocystis sp.]MDW8115572.1 recombinase family protein [Geminocystis sp.]